MPSASSYSLQPTAYSLKPTASPIDHMIILNERHLLRILKEYALYYNEIRPHQSLEGNAPAPRDVHAPDEGCVTAIPFLGGLHHRYERAA